MAGHAEERKRAIGAMRPISNVINNNKETNINLIPSVGVLICPQDAEPSDNSIPRPLFPLRRGNSAIRP